jgi:hypothetical protein
MNTSMKAGKKMLAVLSACILLAVLQVNAQAFKKDPEVLKKQLAENKNNQTRVDLLIELGLIILKNPAKKKQTWITACFLSRKRWR